MHDVALGYDANDRVASIADGLDPAQSQAFAYDELGRLEQAVGPYGTIDYAYDAVGNRLSRTITAARAAARPMPTTPSATARFR